MIKNLLTDMMILSYGKFISIAFFSHGNQDESSNRVLVIAITELEPSSFCPAVLRPDSCSATRSAKINPSQTA